jgi:serine protease
LTPAGLLAQEKKTYPVECVPGRAILELRGVDPAALARDDGRAKELVRQVEGETGTVLRLVRPLLGDWGLYAVRGPGGRDLDEPTTQAVVAELAKHPGVSGASEDLWMRPANRPNDPELGSQWHLALNGATRAWDITEGSARQRVGIVDTGLLLDHEDLAGKEVSGLDFLSDDAYANDGDGRDLDYSDDPSTDTCPDGTVGGRFHGTHVAGITAAATNNGKGVAGINWHAGIVMARALGRCGGPMSDVMDAAAWLAGIHVSGMPDIAAPVTVINMSLSSGSGTRCGWYQQRVLDDIAEKGVPVVVSAGNDADSVGAPGTCEHVITVAAHGPGEARKLASYSNKGPQVTIVAPGGDIVTAWSQGILSLGGRPSEYATKQGTSMAAPFVAGALTLALAARPDMGTAQVVELMQSTGVACQGCDGKKAIQLDAFISAVSGVPLAPEKKSGCSAAPAGSDVAAWLALAAGWVAARRRRRAG